MDMALTLLRGASAIFIKIIHNINHHQHEGSAKDWFSPSNEGHGTAIDRTINYVFVTARRFKNGATDYYAKMGPEFKNQQTVERIILFTFTVTLVIIDIKAFLGFVLPAWIFGNFFLVYTNLIFHKNARPISGVNKTTSANTRECSRPSCGCARANPASNTALNTPHVAALRIAPL